MTENDSATPPHRLYQKFNTEKKSIVYIVADSVVVDAKQYCNFDL